MQLEILVGPIASGKSTYARERAEQGWIVVNDDATFLGLHAGNYRLYRHKLNGLYKAVETSILTHAMAMRLPIVIDRPCQRQSTRRRYAALARTFGYLSRAILFAWEAPEVNAARRFNHDPRGLSRQAWLNAARRHYAEYDLPNIADEGLDELLVWDQAGAKVLDNITAEPVTAN